LGADAKRTMENIVELAKAMYLPTGMPRVTSYNPLARLEALVQVFGEENVYVVELNHQKR